MNKSISILNKLTETRYTNIMSLEIYIWDSNSFRVETEQERIARTSAKTNPLDVVFEK